MKIVLDNSALINLLMFDQEGIVGTVKKFYETEYVEKNTELFAPDLILYELRNCIAMRPVRKKIAPATLESIYEQLEDYVITFQTLNLEDHKAISRYCFIINEKNQMKITHYDAAYLYLAEKLDAKLLTLDKKLVKFSGKRAYL